MGFKINPIEPYLMYTYTHNRQGGEWKMVTTLAQ